MTLDGEVFSILMLFGALNTHTMERGKTDGNPAEGVFTHFW